MFSAFSDLVLAEVSRMCDRGPPLFVLVVPAVCRDDEVTSVRRERVDRVGEREYDLDRDLDRDEYEVVLYTPSE